MDGILPLWKPRGMTSHDCVMKVRKLYKTKKVGHTGTLDPEVEGVLPICIGQATKIVQFLTETKKIYVAEVKLGASTETEDAYGDIIEEKTVDSFPSKKQIENVLQSFVGEIEQVPPMYSAVKVAGKKLYEYARSNQEVERPKRKVTIYHITYLANNEKESTIQFKVSCSKGTYIRTLCVDIGKKFGFPAFMSDLVREETGDINQSDTVNFQAIEAACMHGKGHELLLPITSGLHHLDTYYVDEPVKQKVLHGQKLPKPKQKLKTNPFKVMFDNQLLAIYQVHPENDEEIKPIRVFGE